MKKIIYIVISVLLIASCDSGMLWEDEKYAVYWIDTSENISLGIKVDNSTFIGRYGPPPLKVGSNKKFLVVKSGGVYYYADKTLDDWRNDKNEGRYGPFTEQQFLEIKEKLSLPNSEAEF